MSSEEPCMNFKGWKVYIAAVAICIWLVAIMIAIKVFGVDSPEAHEIEEIGEDVIKAEF
jgi:hypothetical protein